MVIVASTGFQWPRDRKQYPQNISRPESTNEDPAPEVVSKRGFSMLIVTSTGFQRLKDRKQYPQNISSPESTNEDPPPEAGDEAKARGANKPFEDYAD